MLAGYTARVRIVWIYSFGGSDGHCVDNGVGLVVSLDYRKTRCVDTGAGGVIRLKESGFTGNDFCAPVMQ